MRRRCRCSSLIFAVLILGVLVGGIAAWIGQSKWRRTARQLDADVRALHDGAGHASAAASAR